MPETKDKTKAENRKRGKSNTILIFRVPFERKKKKLSKNNFLGNAFHYFL